VTVGSGLLLFVSSYAADAKKIVNRIKGADYDVLEKELEETKVLMKQMEISWEDRLRASEEQREQACDSHC
jgi:DNA gyrase/topoisomerase IV subunit B